MMHQSVAHAQEEIISLKAEIERLRAPFKHAAASDWDYLHRLLVTAVRSSTDQQTLFWLAVFKEARAIYSKAGMSETKRMAIRLAFRAEGEIELIIEALAMAASRHEAMARFRWPSASARRHDDTAAEMRELWRVLLPYIRQNGDALGNGPASDHKAL